MTRNNEKNKLAPRPPSAFHVEIDRIPGGVAVLVSGARAIRELSDTTALLRLKGGFMRINGCNVAVTVYENKTVEVIGGITNIEFENDKT